MSDAFRFETFVDVHGNIFNEYLSSVVARLSKEDEEYKAQEEKYIRQVHLHEKTPAGGGSGILPAAMFPYFCPLVSMDSKRSICRIPALWERMMD